ncbi:MAG: BON domain-containing protein [Planctomycetes bacterium]|nr:BON domain-containing protein [Planctomycetota bacterium]
MKTKSRTTLALISTGVLFMTASTLGASETDDRRIESSAKESYVFKNYLGEDSIKTVSKDGAVVLSGTVTVSAHKDLAQDTVESLPGVTSVDNKLVVKEAAPEYSDAWLIVKINTVLLFHRNVSAIDTKIHVDKGVVTLRGKASSAAQKDLTTEYAEDVDGVKSVTNEMTVVKAPIEPVTTIGEKIDNASTTALVKVTLALHHSTSLFKTSVSTTDGVVTLSGKVKNDAEKSLVAKLVGDVKGVTSVINNMTIEVPSSDKK